LPVQVVLDPRNIPADSPACPAPAVLPKAVRKLGYIPDCDRMRPGDLILFGAVPGKVKHLKDMLGIPAVQEHGGYARNDARWYHAALFLGIGFDMIEANVVRGVRRANLLDRLPHHLIRVRRPCGTNEANGWRMALHAALMQGRPYSPATIGRLAGRAFGGFWRHATDSAHARDALVCSQLYADAFQAAFDVTLMNRQAGEVTPAFLSACDRLEDVDAGWRRLA
jgi:hypothetical protein